MLSLVKKALSGDAEAFIKLIDASKPAMLRIAYGYFSQEADAADAIQDTILDAYEHLSSLKKPQHFKTWLIRILINNCNRIYDKNKKYVSIDEITSDLAYDTQEAAPADLALYRFNELLSYVSKENRLCFQLYYGENLTTKEIADILHINESTIRSRMHREKIKLKTRLLKDGYITSYDKEGNGY